MRIESCKFSYMIGILLLIDVETPKIYIESVVTWPRLLKRWITLQLRPADSVVCFVTTHPADNNLSGGQHYSALKKTRV